MKHGFKAAANHAIVLLPSWFVAAYVFQPPGWTIPILGVLYMVLAYAAGLIDQKAATPEVPSPHPDIHTALELLHDLVESNERWNQSVAKVTGTPPNWNDEYLNPAREFLAKYLPTK